MVSMAEASRVVGVSRHTLYRWIRIGELRSQETTVPGTALRVTLVDINKVKRLAARITLGRPPHRPRRTS